MSVVRSRVGGFAGAALLLFLTACQPAASPGTAATPVSQAQLIATSTSMPEQASETVWGRVPYCNCLVGAATNNVALALKEASLTVRLQEQSPHDGWLYFVATFDPQTATLDQVSTAMVAGGAEVVEGPP